MPPSPSSARRAAGRAPLLAALLVATAAACGGAGERESPAGAIAVEQATNDAVSVGESAREIAAYRLTAERIERWFLAQESLDALVASDPGIEARLRGARTWRGGATALGDAAARLEREPEVRAAIEGAGLSTRDFVMTALALHQALLAAGPGGPPELRRLAARNVRFVSEHADVLRGYADAGPGYLAAGDSLGPADDAELASYVDSLWAADSLAAVDTLGSAPSPVGAPPADSLRPVAPPDTLAPPVVPTPVPPPPVTPPVVPIPPPAPPVPTPPPA